VYTFTEKQEVVSKGAKLTHPALDAGSIPVYVLDPHLRGDVVMDSRLHGNDEYFYF